MCLSSPGGVCLVGGGLPGPGGVCLVLGGSPWSGGCLPGPGGGFSLVRGGSPCRRGGSAWSGGVLPGPGGVLRRPPPVKRITDTCKNITLATTSLRPVKIFQLPCAAHLDKTDVVIASSCRAGNDRSV